jgi:hypothetical protein
MCRAGRLISNISRECLSNPCGVALNSRFSEPLCRGDLIVLTAGNDRFGQLQHSGYFPKALALLDGR